MIRSICLIRLQFVELWIVLNRFCPSKYISFCTLMYICRIPPTKKKKGACYMSFKFFALLQGELNGAVCGIHLA